MIGEVVNNYRIVSLLGEGGMGAVYLAEHPFMGRKAAIKVLRRELSEDRDLCERFMNEARAAHAIHHPNIIDIVDVGRLPSGVPYLMMEFLDGLSLAARIRQAGRVPVAEALDIVAQTAAALGAAHAKEIVHRDLKPDNLFLLPDSSAPSGQRVKVLDFGIAKLRGDLGSGSSNTQSGALMGTPPYMSPEQCRGVTEEVDHRTDIYALGIIGYEMLCGAPPFIGAGWGDVVLAHFTREPVPPRAHDPEIPEAVEALILKALAKTAAGRFQSMGELAAAVRAAGRAGVPAPGVALLPPRPLPAPRVEARANTTFSRATGEMALSSAGPAASTPRTRLHLVVGSAIAASALLAVVTMSGRRARPGGSAAAGGPTLVAPSGSRPAPTPHPSPSVVPVPAPIAPADVEPPRQAKQESRRRKSSRTSGKPATAALKGSAAGDAGAPAGAPRAAAPGAAGSPGTRSSPAEPW